MFVLQPTVTKNAGNYDVAISNVQGAGAAPRSAIITVGVAPAVAPTQTTTLEMLAGQQVAYTFTATSSPALTPAVSTPFNVQVAAVAQIATPNGNTIVNNGIINAFGFAGIDTLDGNIVTNTGTIRVGDSGKGIFTVDNNVVTNTGSPAAGTPGASMRVLGRRPAATSSADSARQSAA